VSAVNRSEGSSRALFRDQLDPRSVLVYLAVTLVLAFTLQHPLYLAALTAAVWLVLVGLVSLPEYRPYLTYGCIAAFSVMLLNPLVSRAGQSVLVAGPTLPLLGPLTISAEAVVYGIGMGLRLLCVVAVFALYATLVDPDALYRLLAPISLGSALVVALSIRLFPATVRDAGRIADAQRSRGLALDAGPWTARIKARVPVMDALVMTSLDRAMSLAEALESRGFGRAGRTRLPSPRLAPRDRAVIAMALACALLGGWLALTAAKFAYYPVLPDPSRTSDLVLAAALGLAVAYPLAFERGWARWLSSRSSS